jgi:amino acid transporter
MATTAVAPAQNAAEPTLRKHALGFPPLIAQSVALISPTMTAVLIISYAFVDAGKGTWAAYLFGTVMLLFVVGGLNQFAKRSATAGSMYAYTARGLGPFAGVMSGWTLMWSYLFIAIAGLGGFEIFAQALINALGIHLNVSPAILFAISGLICGTIAIKDIRVSSLLTLFFEALSVTFILALAAYVLFGKGIHVDSSVLALKGVTLKGMDFAIVICIFSLVGFESATTLGGEARNPLRNMPRAVIWSLLITGAFMVLMSYVEVYAVRNTGTPLSSLGNPLATISALYGVSFFKIPIALGASVSFFSLSLSCLNAGARLAFPLAKHGFLPKALHRVHRTNLTPHVALAAYGAVIMIVAFSMYFAGTGAHTLFDDAGTLAAFGFLLAYFLITVAAPFYLRKMGELRGRNIAIAVAAFACLMVPTVGSFYPAPPWPVNLFPYIFLGYMLAGGSWLYVMERRKAGTLAEIEADLEAALAASAHEAALAEEQHHIHMPTGVGAGRPEVITAMQAE